MATILITGASGLLGAHLMASLGTRHRVVGVDRHAWWGDQPATMITGELTAPEFLAQTVTSIDPDIVIHCAAAVDIETCEQDPAKAYACNAMLTRAVVRAVSSRCLVVYLSTDSVFGGDQPFSTEETLPSPRTVYARSKLHGEWEVEHAGNNHLIIRTNFYGWSSGRKQTSGEWMYQALAAGQPVTFFHDIFFTPIYVMDLVERIMRLMESPHRGRFHVAGRDRVPKYQFGMLMAAAAHLPTDHVRQGSIEDAPLRAPRPKDVSLRSERCARATGLEAPICLDGLQRFIRDRGTPLSARVRSGITVIVSSDHAA